MNIYDMKLHDVIEIGVHNTKVIRIPGGWIYRFWERVAHTPPEYIVNSVFVPYTLEYSILNGILKKMGLKVAP